MTLFRTICALLLVAMPACGRGNEGALQPRTAPGVTLGERNFAGDTAEIARGGVRARVWGDWGSDAGETIEVEYSNTGAAPVSIRVDTLRITFADQQGPVEQISDVTRVNLDDADHRNDLGRSLMSDADAPDRPGIVVVPARSMRRVRVSFLPFIEGKRPQLGDMLTLSVPLAAGAVDVPLRCGGP